MMTNNSNPKWIFAKHAAKLQNNGCTLVRHSNKQIALFKTNHGLMACDNRCPHEGYPLTEGSLSDDCTLTCNWHNWKFNLNTGDNLYGGDKLRIYPVQLRDQEIWIDISDPPYQQQYQAIVSNLHDAFNDHQYDRISREIARLTKLGADPFDVLRLAIEWSWDRLEFGWTHAFAGMADWLVLYQQNDNDDTLKLVCLQESVAHVAYDVLREQEYPYCDTVRAFDEDIFLDAMEQESESIAIACIRGGIKNGMQFADFEYPLTRAALAHYHDFGHSLIYITKARFLIQELGSPVLEPLLLSLVRHIIYATREEKIPEFRAYHSSLLKWPQSGKTKPAANLWHRQGITKALDTTVSVSNAPPEEIYQALLLANAINLLSFDIGQQYKTNVTVSGNVGWLDFTHGITFSNAVRQQCQRFPDLWPQGLLQMACFCGRNAAFTTPNYDVNQWASKDLEQQSKQALSHVLDHGQGEYIVSVHWLKTTLATQEEAQRLPENHARVLGAALNRFLSSPLKRRQTRRIAHQSIQFVSHG